jgi:hypothetical protein
MSTAAQIHANQYNAQHSTGPKTEAGKAISSKNALATGLTGRTVLLPTDDVPRYEAHVAAYRDQFRPANLYETTLVQSIADTDWRLARIPGLLLALEAALDDALLDDDTDTMARIEKQLRNLQLQESRLHRRRTLDCKELRAVQAAREAEQSARLGEAAELLTLAEQLSEPFDPAANGFEFSLEQIRTYRARQTAIAPRAKHSSKLASTAKSNG